MEVDRVRARRLGGRDAAWRRAPARSRSSRWWWPSGPWIAAAVGAAGPAAAARGGRRGTRDVDLLVPPGGRDRRGPGDVRDGRRLRCRPCCTWTATRRSTPTAASSSRTSSGASTSSRTSTRVQGGASPLPKGHEFELDPYPTGTVEPGFPDLWCAALSHCMERFEGSRGRCTATGALRRRRRVHRRQLPGVRPHAAERVRGRRLEPRLQDDRRGPRDRPGADRRALDAAASVPLRALRDRGPAPRVAQPIPLELDAIARRRRRRGQRALGRLAAGRARRRRGRARQGPCRRRSVRHRRRDRPQLLPLGGDHRAGADVGRDVRGGARGVRVPAGGLLAAVPEGAG